MTSATSTERLGSHLARSTFRRHRSEDWRRGCDEFFYLVKGSVRRSWQHRLDDRQTSSFIWGLCRLKEAIRHLIVEASHLFSHGETTGRLPDAPSVGRPGPAPVETVPAPAAIIGARDAPSILLPVRRHPQLDRSASASTAVPSGYQSLCRRRIAGPPRVHIWRQNADPSQ